MDVGTQLAVLTSEVKSLREGLTGSLSALTTRVDGHEREIDALRERQIRFDEREKLRRERKQEDSEGGSLRLERWQLYIALGVGSLGVLAEILNVVLSHHKF